ncbi:hypothetical protein LWI28_000691 [Acer negundo]|uniref:Uncharacterized protein n=1 Tax=Acer negundo TaxID=4023 RepID=A0AAD5NI77_ACENE|nr:hypothetical protein LWI28_000691 [Acer negundo]
MAQGYLGLKQNQELEIVVGEKYFDMLAMCSFFQDFKKDDDDNIITCKMHDIVHDFAQFLVKDECFTMGTSSDGESSCSYGNARHLKMTLEDEEASFPINICSIFKIRSLIVRWKYNDSSSISNYLSNLFKQLTSLRALELNEVFGFNQITKIPSEIGKLIHLRYLNMSLLEGIKELPETLCELYNLQTLNLSNCRELEKLPEGMWKLINLRHLINDETDALSYMPKGIERLVFLRTLSKLVVGGDGDNSQVCSLDCLKKLEYLRGSLVIRGLGNVIDGAEAKNANLGSKKYLLHLELNFDHKSEASSTEVCRKDEAVLEASHPTPNLEKLVLRGYRGITMSFDWMGSLTQLRELTLKDCINCEHLPPLGKLPLLQTLQISGMRSLKRVGNEFLGIKNNHSSSSSSLIFFPKLESLVFEKLENWADWEYEITEDFAIMPCLSHCYIEYCPKLKALPNHFLQAISLKKLGIDEDCPVLLEPAEIYHHLPIKRNTRLNGYRQLLKIGLRKRSLMKEQQKLINLRHLINDETDALSYMPKGIERLVFLRTLSKLVVGGDGDNSQVCSLDCLKKLEYLRGSLVIRGLGNVIDGAEAKNANLGSKKYLLHLELNFDHKKYRGMSFDWMGPLTQLRKLTLGDCINCEHLPPLGKLPLLQTLEIKHMRSLKRVGNEFFGIKNNDPSSSSSSLIFFPKLNHLILDKLENLEDWEYEITKDIAIMPCLSYCEIDRCPKLKALPNHLLQATSLERLDISDCPVLKQWAEKYLHFPITSRPAPSPSESIMMTLSLSTVIVAVVTITVIIQLCPSPSSYHRWIPLSSLHHILLNVQKSGWRGSGQRRSNSGKNFKHSRDKRVKSPRVIPWKTMVKMYLMSQGCKLPRTLLIYMIEGQIARAKLKGKNLIIDYLTNSTKLDTPSCGLHHAGVIWGVEIEKPCSSRSICQYIEVCEI